MSGTTYYQRNKDVILNITKYYYENNKERLREQAINIKTYLKKKKTNKRKYGKNWYHSMSKEKKQKLKKYQKNYREAKKVSI